MNFESIAALSILAAIAFFITLIASLIWGDMSWDFVSFIFALVFGIQI